MRQVLPRKPSEGDRQAVTVQDLLEELHELNPGLDVFIQWDGTREPGYSVSASLEAGRVYINGVSVVDV